MSGDPHPYLDWPGPIPFAHRGGMGEHPENTLAAFEHAVALGYRYLETDVHLTIDGKLVAFHDADLTRTCDHAGVIGELTWAELSEIRVDGREPIPSMETLLENFPEVRFNIDCKSNVAVGPLADLLREHNATDRVCIGSFSHRRLKSMRRSFGTRLLTSMSPQEVAALRLGHYVHGSAPRVAQIPLRTGKAESRVRVELVTERLVRSAHRHEIPVHVWTINDAEEMKRLLDLGVDGIMTDRPELLRDVLIERELW